MTTIEEFIAKWGPRYEELLADLRELAAARCPAPPEWGTPIEELGFSARAYNCLRNEGIETLEQLRRYTRTELLRSKNFGKISLRQVEEGLERRGLRLKA